MYKRFHYLFLSVLCIFIESTVNVHAGELGHFAPSVMNVRDFFVPPEEGIYYVQYNYLYNTDTLKNRNGDEINSLTVTGPLGTTTISVNPDLDVFLIAPAVMWASPWEILGARYAAFVSNPFATNSVQVSLRLARSGGVINPVAGTNLGVETGGSADVYVQPVWLGWSGKHYEASAGYGFYAPSGNEGVSLNFWEQQFQVAGAWFPWEDQRMAVMVAGTYNIPHERTDLDITPGDRFTLNWGISQFLPLKKDLSILAELGVRGYSQWQIEEDSGSDVPQILNVTLNAKDEIHSAGLQAGFTFPQYKANLIFSYMWEFGAEARFEGEWVGMSFVKGF
jgi:hypothetical protein